MSGRRYKAKSRAFKPSGKKASVRVIPLGETGSGACDVHAVRLVSNESLTASAAAQAIELAAPFAEEFQAEFLVTPGGFGVSHPTERSCMASERSVVGFVSDFLERIPDHRAFDIVLGIDDAEGQVQDAYFIGGSAARYSDCQRAWKSYPRADEAERLCTKGRACPCRMVHSNGWQICMLVCHDLAAFSGRSEANRGPEREKWAKQLGSEIPHGPNTFVVHLIHYLNNARQGKSFTSGRQQLISEGVMSCVSTFRSQDLAPSDIEMEKIRGTTARFAGPTLDLYVWAG
jgi:hypothetical protein